MYQWDLVYVVRESASGRAAEMVTFDTADWADALALFDEWSSAAEEQSASAQR